MDTDVVESGPSSVMRRPLVWLSQSVSRRGFLARSFKVTAAALGIAVAYRTIGMPQFPAHEAEASHTCGDVCLWCGLCGKRCDLCGGSSSTCPSGGNIKKGTNSWGSCCGGCCGYRRYYDCCTNDGSSCGVSTCTANCPQSSWCPAGYSSYYCTVSIWSSGCGGC